MTKRKISHGDQKFKIQCNSTLLNHSLSGVYYYCAVPCQRSFVQHCHLLVTVPTCKCMDLGVYTKKPQVLICCYNILHSSGFRLSKRCWILVAGCFVQASQVILHHTGRTTVFLLSSYCFITRNRKGSFLKLLEQSWKYIIV